MSLLFDLTKDDAKILLDSYSKKKQELQAELSRVTARMQEVSRILKGDVVRPSPAVQEPLLPLVAGDGYNTGWTWSQKIKYMMEKLNKPVTTKEIVDSLGEIDAKYKEDRETAVKSVSATLSSGSKNGIYIKTLSERNENQYELA